MRRIPSALLLLLAGCAGTVPDAPSLLPRPIERRSAAEPVTESAVVTPDPALEAELTKRMAVFETAASAFDRTQAGIAGRVERSRGAAEGSDRWLDGQSAIGELQQLRTAVDSAMADVEQLAITRAADGRLPYPMLDASIAQMQARLDTQAATEARIRALIGA